ncbi:MAG: response regulator [bacterium]|nr:response regulator [bacterium]
MINIAVIDDNKEFAYNLKSQIKKCMNIACRIDIFENSAVFFESIGSGSVYHILFMDILLNHENGIDAAQQARKILIDINIIFISVEKSFFMDVYEVNHTYFLTKPIDFTHLKKAINISLENINANSLTIFCKNSPIVLSLNKITFIEGFAKVSIAHCSDGSSIRIPSPLRELDEPLKNHTDFIRTHQSYIVNLQFMKKYERKKIIYLPCDKCAYISRKYADTVDNMITRFLGNI